MPADRKEHMIQIAGLIYGRSLSNSAGGNISLRHAGADGLPDIIKPNASEVSLLLGRQIVDKSQAIWAARELHAWGIGAVVITLGAEGAVAAIDEDLRVSVERLN
jgi:fructose-1-phosphate kinase PfkB-like protein